MVGKLVDDNGTDLSAKYLDRYGPKVDLSRFAPALESAPAIVEGAKGKAVKSTIYAFTDPPTPSPCRLPQGLRLNANSKLMADMGFSGTPTVLYKDASGAYVAIQGMPTLSRLSKTLNMSEQAVTDPELQRFR